MMNRPGQFRIGLSTHLVASCSNVFT